MAGHDFGIQRLPLHPHGDFSARPVLPFLLLPHKLKSFSKLCYSSQSSPLPQGGRIYPSDTIQTQIRRSASSDQAELQ